MSFSDPSAPFVQPQNFPNGIDGMGFWPQFPNEQSLESNGQFHHGPPPFKRVKNSDDMNLVNNNRMPLANPAINQPAGRIFFKTRLCAKFRTGQCPNGENCNFAHGEEDLRKPPPNWQELVAGRTEDRGNGSGSWEDDDRIVHKMKICKKFYNGEECPYGTRCNFLHKEPPKFKDDNIVVTTTTNNNSPPFRDYSRENTMISIGTTGPRGNPDQYDVTRMTNGGLDASRGNSRPVYWKTRLCNRFEDTGHCGFADKCHYAHGRAELLLPGGRSAVNETMTVVSIPVKPAPPPANEQTPMKVDGGGAPSSQEDVERKNILKWKLNKKINRIYGDWIDDLPLPNETENLTFLLV